MGANAPERRQGRPSFPRCPDSITRGGPGVHERIETHRLLKHGHSPELSGANPQFLCEEAGAYDDSAVGCGRPEHGKRIDRRDMLT